MRFSIYGTGGFGREVAPIVRDFWLRNVAPTGQDVGGRADLVFVDDNEFRTETCNGIPVIGFEDLISDEHRDRYVVVAVGNGRTRQKIETRCLNAGINIWQVNSPTARVLDENKVGPGSILCDFVTVTSNATIGKSFQANIYSYVAHDCIIGDYVTFAPRVSCNGNVHIGNHVYVGTGAMIIQGANDEPLTIGEGAIIGMGAVVTKPVEPYTLVAGNPARLVRSLDRPA